MIAPANNDEPDTPEDDPLWGKGELLDDPRHIRRDVAMIRRAIRDDYPIGPKGRKRIANRLLKIVKNGGNREAVGAAMALIAADNVNVKREAMDQKDEHKLIDHQQPQQHEHVHRVIDERRSTLAGIEARLTSVGSGIVSGSPNGSGQDDHSDPAKGGNGNGHASPDKPDA